MKYLVTLFFTLFICLTTFAQDYYWVGGSGNWSDFSNHWATSSGGSTFHTQAPTSSDNVYFDANSFTATSQVVTLDGYAYCNNMDWTGVTNFPTVSGNSNDLFIYGSLTMAADMTADFNNLRFPSTTTGHTITSVGTSLGGSSSVVLEGVGGEWSLQDNIMVNRFYVEAGTFNTNNHEVEATNRFEIRRNDAKTINLGSSTITTRTWEMSGTNQTLNAGTSTIKVLTFFFGDSDGVGPFTYYNLEFDDSNESYSLDHNATFNSIIIPAGSDLELGAGDVFTTINGIISNGGKHDPINIYSDSPGNEATFNQSSGAVTVSYLILTDIHASGGATFTANNSEDNGNTTGWNINAPVSLDYYWVGNGGNWEEYDTHWATTSGGSTFHTDYPGRFDDVHFDGNSFSISGETVSITSNASCRNMDWTGVTNAPIIDMDYPLLFTSYGSLTFTNEVVKDIYSLQMKGTGAHVITYGENSSIPNFSIDGPGTYTLLDSLFVSNFTVWEGTVDLNGNPLNASISFGMLGSSTTINAGASAIYCRDFNIYNSSSTPTFNAGTSTITIDDGILDIQSSSNRSFTFHTLILEGTTEIEGAHTIQNLTLSPGSDVSFEEGTTNVVNGVISLVGNKAAPITLNSSASGTQASISKASGVVDATYLILQDMVATGGATFNASQTIDNGNNTGWNITGLTGDDYFWVGDGGSWLDYANHWATTSGGSTFHVTAPGVLDNVFFDANSFSADNEVVAIDAPEANCNDIDASAIDQAFYLSGSGKEINIYGSVDFPATAYTSFSKYNFLSSGSETVSFNNGPGGTEDVYFLSDGDWTLNSPLFSDELIMEKGTLNTNGHDVEVDLKFQFEGSDPKTLNLGTTSLTVGSFRDDGSENVTLNGGSSDIFVEGQLILNSSPSHSINLNNLTFAEDAGTGTISSSNIVVNTFTVEPGVTLTHSGNPTITATDFVLVGTELNPIVLETVVSSTLTLSQASGTVDADYLQLQDVTATGGATFNAYNSIDNGNVIGWTFFRDSQTISFDAIADKTFGEDPFELSATATSGLTVAFEVISGPATVDGSTITLTGAGTIQIKATQDGNIDYDPAPSVINSFDAAKSEQSITFPGIDPRQYGDPDFGLEVTGGGAISPIILSSSDENVATVSGMTVTIVGVGATTITANQAADDNYHEAAPVEQVLNVSKGDQAITFPAIADYDMGTETNSISLDATATSGLTISYTVDGSATISGDDITPTAIGSITITASQGGNENYHPASDVEQTFEVTESSSPLGLGDQPVGLTFYPNPTKEMLFVQQHKAGDYAIEITSLEGKLIHRFPVRNEMRFDVSSMGSGLYLLMIKRDNRIEGVSRLIVE